MLNPGTGTTVCNIEDSFAELTRYAAKVILITKLITAPFAGTNLCLPFVRSLLMELLENALWRNSARIVANLAAQ
eukprot:10266084-Ditylum_brightwellii.AAC.1